MQTDKPAWLEPEMHAEAIRKIREGDPSLSDEWIRLVIERFAAITESRMDQALTALKDFQSRQNTNA